MFDKLFGVVLVFGDNVIDSRAERHIDRRFKPFLDDYRLTDNAHDKLFYMRIVFRVVEQFAHGVSVCVLLHVL